MSKNTTKKKDKKIKTIKKKISKDLKTTIKSKDKNTKKNDVLNVDIEEISSSNDQEKTGWWSK